MVDGGLWEGREFKLFPLTGHCTRLAAPHSGSSVTALEALCAPGPVHCGGGGQSRRRADDRLIRENPARWFLRPSASGAPPLMMKLKPQLRLRPSEPRVEKKGGPSGRRGGGWQPLGANGEAGVLALPEATCTPALCGDPGGRREGGYLPL